VTPLRSKVVPILVALALVGLSAAGLRLSEPPEETDFEVINGVFGNPVKINNGEVTVTQVRVGTALKQYGEIQDRTDGMFVAVGVTGAATGPKKLELQAARLLSGDVRYEGYQLGAGLSADPGFQTSIESVFEVDPAQIDGLTLEMGSNEILHGYQQRVRIRLGVTPANAAQSRAAAAGVLEPATLTTRAIP
jgi:hypothetical protein